MADSPGLHQGRPVRHAGEPLASARAAMILLHGRGATANDMLSLMPHLAQPGFAYLAPEAKDNTWYPNRYLAPLADNEPWLSSALACVDELMARLAQAGIAAERTILLGFSQGACLTLEYVARHARRYGAVVGLTGALIGPEDTPRDYAGSLQGTPVFVGCSDVDVHVARAQVVATAEMLEQLGGQVTLRLYPGMGHEINQDEIACVRALMAPLVRPGESP